jgi:hypothetical protein
MPKSYTNELNKLSVEAGFVDVKHLRRAFGIACSDAKLVKVLKKHLEDRKHDALYDLTGLNKPIIVR